MTRYRATTQIPTPGRSITNTFTYRRWRELVFRPARFTLNSRLLRLNALLYARYNNNNIFIAYVRK